ncbi:MAG: histone deacetylase [Terrimonas sp.]|nr:histone deacetylase [Terrimonas sp.]
MIKYELIPEQLLYEGLITKKNIFAPGICPDEIVLLTHTQTYFDKLRFQQLSEKEQRRIGFPQSEALTKRELIITQGTLDCCLAALDHGVSLNVAGGTHHAFADRGEGFCLLNDFAVAANYLLNKKIVQKILIIDLDVHQGNGTAKLFEENEKVFTFSLHGRNNYPFHKEKSDHDIAVPDGTDTAAYLQLLYETLPALLQEQKPDFVFYLAGVDILDTDKFGKLSVSPEGCRKRDEYVFSLLQTKGIPCCTAMGGGYSPRVKTIVDAHCNTFRMAKSIFGLD